MRRIYIYLAIMLSLATTVLAQGGKESLKKEYEKYSASGDYVKAIETGTRITYQLYSANNYKDAFEMCRGMNQLIFTEEQKAGKPLYEQRFLITRERLDMYIRLRRADQAELQLNSMEKTASESGSGKLSDMLLYSKANYSYSFGKIKEGDEIFAKVIDSHKGKGEYDKVSECYSDLVEIARRSNNSSLMEHTYKNYMAWEKQANELKAQEKMKELQAKYDESLKIIEDKDSTISVKQYTIISLITLGVILIGVIILIGILLMRLTLSNKRLKGVINTLKENNQRQADFIMNISKQLEPTMDKLMESAEKAMKAAPAEASESIERINAIRSFNHKIEELSALESTLSEPFEKSTFNASTLCKGIIEEAKNKIKPEVNLVTDIPSVEIKSNAEQLSRLLSHLLDNAARYTESGNIRMELKRKGAHVCQFIIADNGIGMNDEMKENLFKPFNEIKDLIDGDSLGLPICAMVATKLNGSLTIDKEYRKGCKFILTLEI